MTWHPPETEVHRPVGRLKRYRRKNITADPGNNRVMHIDMDAFFASVEQRDNPGLRGKPVIVGGLPGERGVVSTCSYEARKFGVKSGMALNEAVNRCPNGYYVRGNHKKYVDASVKIFEIFKKYTPIVEPVSIDEGYLDVSGSINIFGSPREIGEKIKNDILLELGLTCSIGIAHNKIFAKLASGFNKPDGLTIFSKDDFEKTIFPLPVGRLWGIGPKTEKVLNETGIFTIGELANKKLNSLKKYFGINGDHLIRKARGDLVSEINAAECRPDEKSVGHERTFMEDVNDLEVMKSMLLKLSQKVGRRLRKKGFSGKIVIVKVRYSDFETHTHRETYPDMVKHDMDIFTAGACLFDEVYTKGRPIRLIGISVSGLAKQDGTENSEGAQVDMFKNLKKNSVIPVLDELRNKYGDDIITRSGAVN